jgi:hypothetical protein
LTAFNDRTVLSDEFGRILKQTILSLNDHKKQGNNYTCSALSVQILDAKLGKPEQKFEATYQKSAEFKLQLEKKTQNNFVHKILHP